MPKPGIERGSDGLVVYGATTATLAKLKIIELYLDGYATVMGHHDLDWHCLDLFAGPGRNVSELDQTEVDGSPILALRAPAVRNGRPAKSVVAVEKDRKSAAALDARIRSDAYLNSRAIVLPGSHEEKLTDALELIPRTAPSFAVLDPEGFDAPWTTLERLAQHRLHGKGWKMELLILFPSTSVVRLHEPERRDRVDRVYGNQAWHEALARVMPPEVEMGEQTNLFGEIAAVTTRGQRPSPQVAADQFVHMYADRIRVDLGYEFVQPIQIRKSGSSATVYHLVFATDNKAGSDIMRWVAKNAPGRVPGPDGWEVLAL